MMSLIVFDWLNKKLRYYYWPQHPREWFWLPGPGRHLVPTRVNSRTRSRTIVVRIV